MGTCKIKHFYVHDIEEMSRNLVSVRFCYYIAAKVFNLSVSYWIYSHGFPMTLYSRPRRKLEIWGRTQREAVRRRKSNCWDNFGWFKFRGQQRHLANQIEKLSEIAPKFHLGGSTWAPITFLFLDQSSPSFFAQRGRGVIASHQLLFRFSTCGSVPEIFEIKLESC